MKTTLTRLFTVMMLIMVSMGVGAKVDVELNKEYKGGKVEVKSQEDNPDGSTLVTITVIPDQGFTITHSDKNNGVIVVAVRPTSDQSATRAPEIAGNLTVTGPTETVSYPNSVDYQFIVPAGLNAWVQEVKFLEKTSKGPLRSDYSGIWFIASEIDSYNNEDYHYGSNNSTTATHCYLVPAKKAENSLASELAYYTSDETKPYLTTFKTNQDLNSIWILKKSGDYYYIIHALTGKYLVYAVPNTNQNDPPTRRVVHLEANPNLNDPNTKFEITYSSENNCYYFSPSELSELTERENKFLNVCNHNKGQYYATSQKQNSEGLIGKYSDPDNKGDVPLSRWHLEDASSAVTPLIPVTPTITYNNATGEVTISSTDGATIYYTASTSGTEPSDPTSSSNDGTGLSPVTISGVTTPTIYKAIATKPGFDDSNVETQSIEKLVSPSVSFDDVTQKVIITTNSVVEGATNVYTTDGINPTLDSEEYSEPISLTETTTVKAMTVKDGYINSDPFSLTVTKLASSPSISVSGSTVTLSCSDPDAVIYYMTDGTTPTQESSLYDTPFSLVGSQKYTIKAIATKTGFLNSDVAEQVVDNRSSIPVPTITYTGNTVTITANDLGDEIYYTTDGSTPTTFTGTHFTSTGTFNLVNGYSYTVKAIASNGVVNSLVATETIDLTATGYAGIYYFQNNADRTYYMYPVGGESALVKTAKKTDQDAIWKIEIVGDYYHIIHYKDGKYLVAADVVEGSMPEEETVSLVETDNPGENALFEITRKSGAESDILQQIILIRPKAAANADGYIYLNTRNGNNGTNKIGLYDNTGSSEWKLATVPAKPTFTVNDINVTISSDLDNVYYTIDGTTPTSSSTLGKNVTLEYGPSYTVNAICIYHDNISGTDWASGVATSNTIQVGILNPIITCSGNNVVITNSQASGVTFRYTFSDNGTDPADPVPGGAGTNYESPLSLTANARNVFKAIAYNVVDEMTYTSEVVTFVVDLRNAVVISSLAGIDSSTGSYKLASGFSATGTPEEGGVEIGTSSNPFKGTIDGDFVEFELGSPLFDYVKDATIKNVIVSKATISTSGNAGAIANNALGDTHIYNCGVLSGSVNGDNYVGGLVGLLDGYSRVINCYSFATVGSGAEKGGIVGYNNYASKSKDIRTMVMNCMFYGDIATGGTISPIYGGYEINNEGTNSSDGRLNNYNYFRVEAPFSKNNKTVNGVNTIITKFNRALSAEERYLNRFEFYRYLLNSNRELAAAYIGDTPTETGTGANLVKRYHKEKMAKWVFDKSIAPYPILKEQGIYPSVVNYDPQYTNDEAGAKVLRSSVSERNKGKELGSVTVTISGVGANAPSAAKLVDANGDETTSRTLTLYRTDKDYINFNYNYDKIQLPYYNEVGKGNYTGNMVVTGWKVRTSSKAKSFGTANYDYPNYNLADRSCIEGRVFSQGAYFDVPEGTNSISIEPYWGNAVYVSDGYHDSYSNDDDYTPQGLEDFGKKYVNDQKYYINPNDNSAANYQKVYNGIGTALGKLPTLTNPTVYDYAVVLVGNYHCKGTPSGGTKPFTIMSADLDHDNEPDYSLIIRSGKQEAVSPIRFDFINVPGVVMAHKKTSTTQMGILGNMKLKGWFEVTNTCVIRFSQFEYDYTDNNSSKAEAPLILLGGVVEQFVSTNTNNVLNGASHTKYIHLGSNVWFKLFNNGCHMDKTGVATPHRPISVTGGEYEKFYLSGYFQPNAPVANNADDKNAECYIDGGKFGEVAGAGQELVDGDVTWVVNHADIESFFGGGINDAKAITGNINVTIKNSHVGLYCGGPKFGNMAGVGTPDNQNDDKTVSTTAEGSTFGNFYGAGYGGTALYRDIWSPGNNQGHNQYQSVNYSWTDWLADDRGYSDNHTPKTRGQYVAGKGIAVGFETEQFEGSNDKTVARLYVNFATLSVAKTNGVTSNLTGCTINQNFFGGGNLGSVNGNINSTLTNCKVYGSVFGAGCSAMVPTADVYDSPTTTNFTGSSYNTNTGVFAPTDYPDYVEYTWSNTEGNNSDKTLVEKDIEGSTEKEYWIHVDYDANTGTGINLNELGVVKGTVTVNLEGNTLVMGKIFDEDGNETGAQTGGVFGGGDASATQGDTEVNINTTSTQSAGYNANIVYGGGNEAEVRGDTEVNLHNGVINGNVFGGGNKGVVSGSATVNIE